MDGVAVRDAGFRRRLFEETGSRMNLDPLIVEKDFWVCWTLKCLFSLPDMRENLVLKGGTSLSKVYKVIHRFSEDIDLTVNRVSLGFERDNDLANIKSNKQRDRSIGQMVAACSRFVDSDLRQKLDEVFVSYLKDGKEQWSLVIDEQDRDGQTLLFNYPDAVVKPYAAEYFPDVFSKNQECEVIALKAERTFWEKATILHQEANRSKDRPFPLRLLPPDFRLPELQKDYEKMQIMMFEKSPSFQEILDMLLELESTINSTD